MTDPKPETTNPEEAFGLAPVPDMPEESIEPPLSPQDQAELDALTADPPSYHTILEIWQSVLKPAQTEQTQRVGPGWASRITQMYPQIKIQDMQHFRDRYFAKVLELAQILDAEISTDPRCLKYDNLEDDAELNRYHYKNLLLLWQQQILEWEMSWDCTDELSAVELGAISETHKMFFNETGFVAYLDNIGLRFTDDDQQEMQEALEEFRKGLLNQDGDDE